MSAVVSQVKSRDRQYNPNENAGSFEAGADRRELWLSQTAAGKREYEHALPYWESA